MKTSNQVEVIVFKQVPGACSRFLMLKRTPEKGSFWQPITGNVEVEESFEEAAIRELKEETGISEILRLIDTDYAYEFFDNNRKKTERVYGAEISPEKEVMLSAEHTEYAWVSEDEAINKYLK